MVPSSVIDIGAGSSRKGCGFPDDNYKSTGDTWVWGDERFTMNHHDERFTMND